MKEFRFPPHRIFNLDETGTSTVQSPSKVLSQKGVKQLGFITSAERGTLVTMCNCVSATGQALPPVYIFPRVNFKGFMLNGAPAGSLGLAARSGWMTNELFIQTLQHFSVHIRPTKDDPVLLLLDNHSTHCTIEVIRYAQENGIVIITFPPHCSHKLQPLDVGVYGPFKRSFNDECNAWMVSSCNSRKTISIYEIAALTKKAFHKAIVPGNITSEFRACGLFPFDRNIFCDNDFVADALAAATSSKPYGEGLPALPSVEAQADTSRKVGEPPRF